MKSSAVPSTRTSVLILIAVSIAIYANTLFNGFTIDDFFAYANNAFVHDLRNLRLLFDAGYFKYSNEASYRPVCTLTYFLDGALWGNGAVGPHLTNVILYAMVVCSFFFLCRQVLRSERGAFLAALLFAVHPLHTEVVNNIAFREDLLVALLLPVSWLLYRHGKGIRAWLCLPAAWAAYFLALLSKESAIVFPALVILLEWGQAGGGMGARGYGSAGVSKSRADGRRNTWLFAAGVVVLTILFLLIRFHWMQFPGEAEQPQLGGSLLGTFLADVKIQARYWILFFFPFRLSALYPPAMFAPRLDPLFFLSLAGLLLVPVLLLRFRRSRTFVSGVLWWFICLAPVANVYPIFNPMAERYLFLASMGPCLLIGDWVLGIRDWGGKEIGRVWRAGIVSLLVVWCVVAIVTVVQRNQVWRDNMSLWTATAQAAPDNPTVISNLAAAYYEKGDYAKVIEYGERAIDLWKRGFGDLNPAATYVVLAGALHMKGDRAKALEYLLAAEALVPCRFDIDLAVYRNIGLIYDDWGQLEEAVVYYGKAVGIDPFRPGLWRKISFCRLRLGDCEQAEQDWSRARKLDEDLPSFEKIEKLYRNSQAK